MILCRICLANNGRLYSMQENGLEHIWKVCTGTLGVDERLPQHACAECSLRLLSFNQFRCKSLKSFEILNQMLNEINCISEQRIIQINRKALNLESKLCYSNTTTYQYLPNNEIQKQDDAVTLIVASPIPNDFETDQLSSNNDALKLLEPKIEEPELDNEFQPEKVFSIEKPYSNEIYLKNETDDDNIEINYDTSSSLEDIPLANIYSKKAKKVEAKKLTENKAKKRKNQIVKKVIKKRQITKKKSEDRRLEKQEIDGKRQTKKEMKLEKQFLDAFNIIFLPLEKQREEIEKRQESLNYKRAPFKCTECFKGLLSIDSYNEHMLRHSDKFGEHECTVCKCRFSSPHALQKHRGRAHWQKFSCKLCDFVTTTRTVASRHEEFHRGVKHKCTHCGLEFSKATTYKNHIRIKHPSDHICVLCGYSYVGEKGLMMHRNLKHRFVDPTVPADGPTCDACEIKFASDEAYTTHLQVSAKHRDDPEICAYLHSKGLKQILINQRPKSNLTINIPRVRRKAIPQFPDSKGPLTCEVCNEHLENFQAYYTHFRRAHPGKHRTQYQLGSRSTACMCDLCGRLLTNQAALDKHVLTHRHQRAFKPLAIQSLQCDTCGKVSSNKGNLRSHMLKHDTNRTTYPCHICGRVINDKANLRRHVKLAHTNERPFPCEVCQKSFKARSDLLQHHRHVHMKVPWPRKGGQRRGNSGTLPDQEQE